MAIVATMWKPSCLLLLLITVGYCATHDNADIAVTEGSRNDRDHENRKHRSEVKDVAYVEDERPYEDDYTKPDSEEFRGGKLIGKWRNNGAAFEPKWRDGDSVPLVPFNAAKQTKVGRHDGVEGPRYRDSSHAVTKPFARDASVGRTPDREGSVEDTIPAAEDYPATDRTKDDRSLEKDYNSRDEYDDSRGSEFSSQPQKARPAAILTDSLRYETTKDVVEPFVKLPDNDDKIGSILSRSRYRDTFQVHPNEYELNDEEYQKPRPRKRRPPQNYEFSEIRAPTYSITWSTERYIESTPSPDRPRWSKDPDQTRRRPEKPAVRRDRNRNAAQETQRVSENAELKSLLKMQQTEGLSLSELLQRRNLTLNDLLKGKPEVISVLKKSESREEEATELSQVKPKIFETTKTVATTARPKWRPSQTRNKSSDSGNEVSSPKSENDVPAGEAPKTKEVKEVEEEEDEESLEHLDSAETEDGQRKSNDNEKLSAIVRLTKPIILPRLNSFTEKSIIVTTGPVATEFIEVYQNDEGAVKSDDSAAFDDDEIMEFSDFTGKKNVEITTNLAPGVSSTRYDDSRLEDAYEDTGSTLSIQHILSMTEQTVLPTTQEPSNFDNKENSVAMQTAHNDTDMFDLDSEYQSDEPQEFAEERSEEELPMGDQPYVNQGDENEDESSREEEAWKNHQIFSTSSKPYEVVVSEIEPEARAEIFELFSSGSSAKRLERLLKSRNMSIDELIALRQRGSSRVHMAEVLRTRETLASRSQSQRVNSETAQYENKENARATEENLPATTMDDLSDIEIEMTTTREIPAAAITEEQTNIASVRTEQTFSASTTEQTNVYSVRTERTESSTTEEKLVERVQLLELLTAFDSLPFSVRPDLDREKTEETKTPSVTDDRRVPEDFVEKTKRPDLPTSLVEVGLVEEIAREDSIPFQDSPATNVRTNYSSTLGEERKNLSRVRPSIIASGAILGVTIVVFLAIFIVCRIRQKQKYTYRNTFSRGVFQGPAMTARKLSNSSSLNTIMVNVVATSTNKRPERNEQQAIDDEFDFKSDIENDSLDANDSWDTIPDFMK